MPLTDMPLAKLKMIIYPDFGHESAPGCSDTAFRFLAEL